MRYAALLLLPCLAWAQNAPLKLNPPVREMPAYIQERLDPKDRALFGKLMRVGLESAWALVTAEGYPQCFINELTPLKPNHRMVGRARTIRYLPNRKDVRARLYSAGPQLNYKSARKRSPEISWYSMLEARSARLFQAESRLRVSLSAAAQAWWSTAPCATCRLEAMHLQVYMRRGHAASVSPIQMSV